MLNRVWDLPLRSTIAVSIRCDSGQWQPKRRGIVIVTTGPDRDMRTFIVHLQTFGIQHVTEVRRLSDPGSSLSCTVDRRNHRFMEEILNGVLWKGHKDFEYRCLDVLDQDSVKTISEKVAAPDVDLVAAVPRSGEDVISLSDRIASGMQLPLIANDATTTAWRIDKYEMQEALGRYNGSSVLQVRASSLPEARKLMDKIGLVFPVVVKPVNSWASDGVVLCWEDSDLAHALDININKVGLNQTKHTVTIQEYLQGDEFVVNTVSLLGNHRVLDMWRVTKTFEGRHIFYDHQLLVADPGAFTDVTDFSFKVLDAVGFRGGAAHLEVVRTKKGMRLIEINPRAAGHNPRAAKQVGEDQFSALALALGQPDRFVQRAIRSPCYAISGTDPDLVMVIFLRACRNSEVHRDDLMSVINLKTFWRFDRINVPMFDDAVKEAKPDSFWIAAHTDGLFTVPLTVLLRGKESALLADLERIRRIEHHMYKEFGAHDPANREGALEGASAAVRAWNESALARADVPKIGSRLQVLLGRSFRGGEGNVDYYKELDFGTVSKLTEERMLVTWERTGLTTSISKLSWKTYFTFAGEGPEVPQVGCRLLALPGKQFQYEGEDGMVEVYQEGDEGTVTAWKDNRLLISWDRTGLACSLSQQHWAERFKLVSQPEPDR